MIEASIDIRGIPEIQDKLDALSGSIGGKRLMSEIATFLMSEIKIRTSKGKDVDGVTFKPYSKRYAFFRQKKGHPIDKVTLFFTGSMMSSMTYTTTRTTARLFFMNTEDKEGGKNPLKAFALNEKREFFAMSQADIKEITEIVNDHIRGLLD